MEPSATSLRAFIDLRTTSTSPAANMRRFSARLFPLRSVAASPSDFHRTTQLGRADLLQELEFNVLMPHKERSVEKGRFKSVAAQRFDSALSVSERAEWALRAVGSRGSLDHPDSVTPNRIGIENY